MFSRRTLLAGALSDRLALCALLAFLLLSAAYALQYLLGYHPCSLCQKQRVVWWAVLVCAGAVSFLPAQRRSSRVVTGAALLASLLLLAGGVLAAFHLGLERGWWHWALLCEGFVFPADTTPEELRAMLLEQDFVPCDRPALRVVGFSLSEYNALFSFSVLGWLAGGVWRELRKS